MYISSSGEISASYFRVDQYGTSYASRMLIGNDVQADSVHGTLGFFGDKLLVGGI